MAKTFILSDWARPEMLALSPYTSARDSFTATDGEWVFWMLMKIQIIFSKSLSRPCTTPVKTSNC
jgi:hypothetical protein